MTTLKTAAKETRSSFDSNQTFNEKEATAHDLLTDRSLGAGISIQTAAIFAKERREGTCTKTRNHG